VVARWVGRTVGWHVASAERSWLANDAEH
jgi:hypothetical protein